MGEIAEQNLALQNRPPGNDFEVPELSKEASIKDVIKNGFARNPKVRAAFNDWVATLEQIPQAGSLPDPRFDISLDAQYLLGFDPVHRLGLQSARRLTMKPAGGNEINSSMREHEGSGRLLDAIGIGFSQEVPGRGKREARANQALSVAQATGLRFLNTERELRRDIIKAYSDLLLNRRRVEVEKENVRLLEKIRDTALDNLSAGIGNEADVLKSEISITQGETDLRAIEIEEPRLVGALNALIARDVEKSIGKLSSVKIDWENKKTAELLKTAVAYNPELTAMAADVSKQDAAVVLARLERNPDFTLGTSIGAWQQMIRAGLSLPINNERIEAGIREAQASRAASQNRYSAAVFEAMARLVASLSTIKDSERILDDYGDRLIPQLQELVAVQIQVYGSGTGASFLDILDTRRSLIQSERLIIQAEAERLKSIAELEEIAGTNLLTLSSVRFDPIKPVDLDKVKTSKYPTLPGTKVDADSDGNSTTNTSVIMENETTTPTIQILPSLIEAPTRPEPQTTPSNQLLPLPSVPADSGTTIGQSQIPWRPLAGI